MGISSYTYAWAVGVPGYPPDRPMGALDLLDKAEGLGVHVLQVADNLPLHQLSDGALEAFARRAARLEIDLEVGTRGIERDHLRTYLHLATRLRSPILRVVVDDPPHYPSEAEVVDVVRAIIPELERAGVCLAIENHDRFTARALARILERVDSEHAGVCLDTANSFGVLEGPEVVVDTLAPWAVNVHVKDFVVRRASHGKGFAIEGRPAGQGQLDIPWLLQKLHDLGRDPNVILELWTPPEAELASTIQKESAWAATSIETLRRFVPD